MVSLRLWVKTEDYWDVYYNMIEKIRECFQEDGIEIPYQRLDVNVMKSDDNK